MKDRNLSLRIVGGAVLSFVLWGALWLLASVGNSKGGFEVVHVTPRYQGTLAFLGLALAGALLAVGISLLSSWLLPKAMKRFEVRNPVVWAGSGLFLAEAAVWATGILVYLVLQAAEGLMGSTPPASSPGFARGIDFLFLNLALWVAVALPYGAVDGLVLRRAVLGSQPIADAGRES